MTFYPFMAQVFGGGGSVDLFSMMLPMLGIFAVFYFFTIRPQQKKQSEHQKMLSGVTRGDTVITNGGLIGKVVRVVDDNELLVEVGPNVQVRILRQGLSDIRSKSEPQKAAK